MAKVFLFTLGLFTSFYLWKCPATHWIIWVLLISAFMLLFILGYLFHLGVSDFQDFEHDQV